MTSVCAFVLTRNRKALLVECVRGLLAQTHPVEQVIVLDNASTDGTEEHLRAEGLLDEPRVRFERREENTGGAGGYREGVRLGVEAGRDWLWLMDDDAEPRHDALETLLGAADEGDAAVCSAVVHPDGSIDLQHRCRMARFIVPLAPDAYAAGRREEVECASFVGLLMRTPAARAAGLPIAEFFIGYDDAEYSLRLREHGRIRLVPESEILHKVPIGGGGATTRRARFFNSRFGLTYAPVPWEAFWRDLYRVRNFMWIKQHHGGLSAPAFALLTGGYLVKSLMYDPQPLRRLPWLVRFARKGRRGDWSAPSPQEWPP
jgi:rhamnopyranosyl-N-acetylglucosaminyl-diphospho-decaprenol beta-1,3/1,4-galactofuranosyltransferase